MVNQFINVRYVQYAARFNACAIASSRPIRGGKIKAKKAGVVA